MLAVIVFSACLLKFFPKKNIYIYRTHNAHTLTHVYIIIAGALFTTPPCFHSKPPRKCKLLISTRKTRDALPVSFFILQEKVTRLLYLRYAMPIKKKAKGKDNSEAGLDCKRKFLRAE